jgi:hypothetical protein
MRRHDIRHVIEAGFAMGTYDAGSWIGEIDVPTAVVVSAKDRVIDVSAQLRMALKIEQARVFPVADGHLGVLRPEFCNTLATACRDVATRACSKRLQREVDREVARRSSEDYFAGRVGPYMSGATT